MAAPVPNASPSPVRSAPPCRAANPMCVAGRPRRVWAPSMTSSWTRALACTNSSAATARRTAASSSPARRRPRRRASPSRRRPGAAACRPRRARDTSSATGTRLGSIAARVVRCRSRNSVSASVTAARSRSSPAAASDGSGRREPGSRSCVPAVTDPVSTSTVVADRGSRTVRGVGSCSDFCAVDAVRGCPAGDAPDAAPVPSGAVTPTVRELLASEQPDVVVRVLPDEDARGRGAAVDGAARARAAAARRSCP